MEITDFLSPDRAFPDIQATDKDQLLQDLALRAAAALNLPRQTILGPLLQREELGSTGMGNGVAIPHARYSELNRPLGLVARLRKPIDFGAIDDQPVDVVFLLLLPATSGGGQLNALASVARKLREPDVLRRVREAADRTAVFDAVAGENSAYARDRCLG